MGVSIHKNKILNADHLSFSDLQIIHIYERQRAIKCISNLTMKFWNFHTFLYTTIFYNTALQVRLFFLPSTMYCFQIFKAFESLLFFSNFRAYKSNLNELIYWLLTSTLSNTDLTNLFFSFNQRRILQPAENQTNPE